MNYRLLAAALLAGCLAGPAAAADFTLSFEWGSTPVCTTGVPEFAANPPFVVTGVPPGTRALEFEMLDMDAPDFHHGGGIVKYHGQRLIAPGAFGYLAPCPPRGRHYYLWTVIAKDRAGTFARQLGHAKAGRSFPP